ncbi:MAG TPA: TRAP transporter substrate-binding protein [Chloroflexota bacterium]|nr:TRAP transporter substrate-binding protein [Chloroflexota bacterium]
MSRRFLLPLSTAVALAVFLVACSTAAPTPTSAPAKPAEPTKAAAPAASPAASQPTTAAAAPTKAAAAPATGNFPKTDIRLGHSANLDLNYHKGSVRFAELVKERTGGQVTVTIYPNSQLGTEPQVLEQVKGGLTQMTTIGAAIVASFQGWEPLGVFSLPYIMKGNTEEEQYKVFIKLARSPKMQEIANNAAQVSGVRALDFSWWYGFRNLTTKNKAVIKADDVKGLKIRTPDAPIHKVALQTLGASVVGMGFAELYSALQMGVVDGQENPAQTIFSNKFWEVQKNMALSGHMTQHQFLMINDKFYQGLSPELRAILDKAAIEAGEYQSQLQLADNKKSVDELKAKGMQVNEIDRADWAAKTKDAWKQFQPGINQELMDWFNSNQ